PPPRKGVPGDIKLADLTAAGWALTAATVVLVLGLMGVTIRFLWGGAYSGRGFALAMALPGLLAGVAFFALGAFALKAAGLPVVRRPAPPAEDEDEDEDEDEEKRARGKRADRDDRFTR
ncbi:MAG: hypothetical protein ACRC33_15845, partial [Gemmataceae bacterium]